MKHAPGGHKTARHLHLFGRLRRQGASPAQSSIGEQQPLTSTRRQGASPAQSSIGEQQPLTSTRRQGASPAQSSIGEQQPLTSTRRQGASPAQSTIGEQQPLTSTRRQGASPAQSSIGEQQPLTSTRLPRCSSPGLCGVLPRSESRPPGFPDVLAQVCVGFFPDIMASVGKTDHHGQNWIPSHHEDGSLLEWTLSIAGNFISRILTQAAADDPHLDRWPQRG
ncbi:hypothetical protein RRG08_010406 [Elysia crispata]|uniref:Uncharacterized protein n=1 Tax=Elysia crispata TaxID=231223 RepID=A0AAE1EDF2_9GAST|nr:hypothetical protein RRG08_010406 [Elysia crispata]